MNTYVCIHCIVEERSVTSGAVAPRDTAILKCVEALLSPNSCRFREPRHFCSLCGTITAVAENQPHPVLNQALMLDPNPNPSLLSRLTCGKRRNHWAWRRSAEYMGILHVICVPCPTLADYVLCIVRDQTIKANIPRLSICS